MELDIITQFFDLQKPIAVVGVSRNNSKFGYQVYALLQKNGFKVLPINPHVDSLHNNLAYKKIQDLPKHIDRIIIITAPSKTDMLIHEAAMHGIKYIWVQQGCETSESVSIAQQHGVQIITKRCVCMFAPPVQGFHKFHKNIIRFFGGLPK